jgi:RimJ/RimL family protein N-acetyltransferase
MPHWRQGYTTETGAAILRDGGEVLELTGIYASHPRRDTASGRMLQTLLMTHEGHQCQQIIQSGAFSVGAHLRVRPLEALTHTRRRMLILG